jgi:hypothetical protein
VGNEHRAPDCWFVVDAEVSADVGRVTALDETEARALTTPTRLLVGRKLACAEGSLTRLDLVRSASDAVTGPSVLCARQSRRGDEGRLGFRRRSNSAVVRGLVPII